MKAKFIFITLMVGASLITFAQSLVLHHEGEILEPNAEIIIEGAHTASELIFEAEVENISNGEIEVNVQRYEFDLNSDHINTMCWAGQCYSPFTGLPPNTVLLPAGGTISPEDAFSGHLQPNGTIAISTIAYTFFDVNNPNDSVRVVVQYAAGTWGISDSNNEEVEVLTYPNPATDVINFNIKTDINEVITYEVLNITGVVVRSKAAKSNNAKFSVSDLAEGLYIYRVSSDKKIIKSGRVVIKH